MAAGSSIVHDYQQASRREEAESTSKKLIGALTKLNPFNKKPDNNNANKYSPTIVHTSASGQAPPPQVWDYRILLSS
jgi:hypothetical protein